MILILCVGETKIKRAEARIRIITRNVIHMCIKKKKNFFNLIKSR